MMKITNKKGVSVDFLDNGLIRAIEADPIRISLRTESPFSGVAANIWLRKRGNPIEFAPLTGPGCESWQRSGESSCKTSGSFNGIDYNCRLTLSPESLSWEWKIGLINNSGADTELDLIYLQDVGLKIISPEQVNEYYVSQYIERRIFEDKLYGSVICCRQNLKEADGHPWLMIAAVNGAASACIDGMQFYGKKFRETGTPEGLSDSDLGGEYAGESSVVALQRKPFILARGEKNTTAFVAIFLHNHQSATSIADLDRLPGLVKEFPSEVIADTAATTVRSATTVRPGSNLFNNLSLLRADDLSENDLDLFFGKQRIHCETYNGSLLSFFRGKYNHVMLRAKELLTDRPHGHIMQAMPGLVPDESIMSTTAFAFGVFNSHVTQGNTNFTTLLSICNSQFNLAPEKGQRIFVDIDGEYRLLGVPSAFEMGLNHCTWIYRYGDCCLQIRTWTSIRSAQINMEFRVIQGKGMRIIVTNHFDRLNGWKVTQGQRPGEYIALPDVDSMVSSKFPEASFIFSVHAPASEYLTGGDELISDDGIPQGSNMFVIKTEVVKSLILTITGGVTSPSIPIRFEEADMQWDSDCSDALQQWNNISLNLVLKGSREDTSSNDISIINYILPWYGMNALIHYLTPYGLEQFSGAAWGTRDVAQGPVEMLLSLQKYSEVKQILRIIFSHQNPDGGWPQWWMFDSFSEIRADSAHGDVIYWILIALCSYIRTTDDFQFLEEELPYYKTKSISESEVKPLDDHINRLIKKITDSFVPGTTLTEYGGGDWNDSLQPVSRDHAKRMISSWTVEMNYQAFREYAEVCLKQGDLFKASEIDDYCDRISADFNKYLVKDGVVAGYGLVEDDETVSHLLHPTDQRTGIKYSLLPMERGILSGIFTPEQKKRHMELIKNHLTGPDGARLMDRPLKYSGGLQKLFQRAESSTFFGREIGLMYTHEHIRYAEALAITGKADEFLRALRQAVPVGCRETVPCADIRQSNCYYSSSDIIFKSRYEADELYNEVISGMRTFRGGWRVYSSGPGIFTGIIIMRFLGLRIEWGNIIIDPVIPSSIGEVTVSLDFMGCRVSFKYIVEKNNFGPYKLVVNGNEVAFTHDHNPYRKGGALINKQQFITMLDNPENRVEVWL